MPEKRSVPLLRQTPEKREEIFLKDLFKIMQNEQTFKGAFREEKELTHLKNGFNKLLIKPKPKLKEEEKKALDGLVNLYKASTVQSFSYLASRINEKVKKHPVE